ncbi:hypothetical protein Taro_027980 [Colocasia esculenta]|uniref:Uncharacterized protein n=1 Tax=Colocasia esculenta TaxID=4460 RepID=A0A843VLR3_COLES|nr:hypothetical protein [Colocasia esculenta]
MSMVRCRKSTPRSPVIGLRQMGSSTVVAYDGGTGRRTTGGVRRRTPDVGRQTPNVGWHQTSAVGCWASARQCRTPAVGRQEPAGRCRTSALGVERSDPKRSDIECRLLGVVLPATDHRISSI